MNTYWGIVLVMMLIGVISNFVVSGRIKKYRGVSSSFGINGKKMANTMLADNGINDVKVIVAKSGRNHYNPNKKRIALDIETIEESSVTSMAIACHEAGHACQDKDNYFFLKFRCALAPVVSLVSNAWFFVLVIGFFLSNIGFVNAAIIMYAAVLVFHIITIPVELNASKRATEYLQHIGMNEQELAGAKSVLSACAFTYVCTALISFLSLIRLLFRRFRFARRLGVRV